MMHWGAWRKRAGAGARTLRRTLRLSRDPGARPTRRSSSLRGGYGIDYV